MTITDYQWQYQSEFTRGSDALVALQFVEQLVRWTMLVGLFLLEMI